ncbi:F0F1 ATP synthase subunit delta [Ferrovibrio sp.]|uniref:F0F1 ATP synthase subunit delta n=1 Tax=Ferrovibrio sp. TaxID=1917215 RepID=UPI003D09F56C
MAQESALVSGIAGRYATALFDMARDSGQLDAVANDLEQFTKMLADSADLVRLIRSPAFSRAEQGAAITAVMEKAGFNDLTRRFVGVLAQNRRLFALADVISAYKKLLSHHRGEVVAEVVSAAPLDEQSLAQLKSALSSAAAGNVVLQARVEPELIGGLVVKLGSRMIDASVRAKLNSLKSVMKGVA